MGDVLLAFFFPFSTLFPDWVFFLLGVSVSGCNHYLSSSSFLPLSAISHISFIDCEPIGQNGGGKVEIVTIKGGTLST
jgi:hypothetical protein